MPKKLSIEIYYDPLGIINGQPGCWRARLADEHGIHEAGSTEEEVLLKLEHSLRVLDILPPKPDSDSPAMDDNEIALAGELVDPLMVRAMNWDKTGHGSTDKNSESGHKGIPVGKIRRLLEFDGSPDSDD